MLTKTELAMMLGISVPAMNHLAFNASNRYRVKNIVKRNGDMRVIHAPSPLLLQCLSRILFHYRDSIKVSEYAHGFVPGRSIVTNAMCHVSRKVVINLDLTDFFPSVTFQKVKRVFSTVESDTETVSILSMLCTEPNELEKRVLPQGSPVSPLLSNASMLVADNRIAGFARSIGFSFTRYADDLTFSGDRMELTNHAINTCTDIVKSHGFRVNTKKTTIKPYYFQQSVTGIIVNGIR